MLRQVEHEKILEALGPETRLVLALSAYIIQALNHKLSAEEAVTDACKVFSVVFPEKKE